MKKLLLTGLIMPGMFYAQNNVFPSSGNVGIGDTNPNSALVVGNNFGANISGSSAGNAIFGSNLAVIQGGDNHNKLFTPTSHTGNYGYSGIRSSWGKLFFYTGSGNTIAGEVIAPQPRVFINEYGNMGVGTVNPGTWKLAVNGDIRAKEIKVETGWSDFVFEEHYSLPTLEEVEQHIKEKGHLKDIPSAREVEENGILLGEMDAKLLQKIEELTLYMIDLKKENKEQKFQIEELLKQNSRQQEEIDQLKKQ